MLNPKEKEFKVGDTVMVNIPPKLRYSMGDLRFSLNVFAGKKCRIDYIHDDCTINVVKLSYMKDGNRVHHHIWIPVWALEKVKDDNPRIKVGDFVVPRIHEKSNLFGRITKFIPVQVLSVKEDTCSGVIKVELSSGGWVEGKYLDVVKADNQISMSNIGKNISTGQKETTAPMLDLKKFYQVAALVKPRSKEQVALHLAAEAGEIAECLIQPERNGNLVEESVDAILCALDLVYLELGKTHGEKEITEILNKNIAEKLDKWYRTCKSS
ncbi:hypothetical protein PHYNN_73 [Pantoea phage Phynn]|nr:hypothetical protein PHYNN_73 [Pantoea phage Phynn]